MGTVTVSSGPATEAAALARWTQSLTVLALRLRGGTTPRDVIEAKAVLAAKPTAGLDAPWWELVDAVAAWVEGAERQPLPGLGGSSALLLAALDAPPRPRFAWQDRADA